jgi:methylated-DNA-protein-cysteine methyltransferase related protein
MKKGDFFSNVYKLVKKIPEGKVMTYGQIAEIIGTKDARKVGWALHGNKDPEIPCHRVVNKDGAVAVNYAFGGEREQKMRLLSEGVKFKDKIHVDLGRFLWK